MPARCQEEYESSNLVLKEGWFSESLMKPRTAQLGVRENPASLLRQHGSRLAAKQSPLSSENQIQEAIERTAPASVVVNEQRAEPFLDCTAAAVVLGGVHPKTVERWAREGRIPAYRYFRCWRFRASELELWMHSHVKSGCHPCRLNQEESNGA